jgi:cytidylate kinase
MPIITISRGTFSGGRALAGCLARRLGYPCISREVLAEAAARYEVPGVDLDAALATAPSVFDRLGRDRDRYLCYIRAVLCQHARAGDLVYHGHAGHHLLAGIRHVIRARVVADIGSRVRAAMQEMNMTSRQAELHIRKVDAERRKWTRFLYGVAWEDPFNYDVVLNLEHAGIDGACEVLAGMARLEMFQATEESRAALDDLALSSSVAAALGRDERTRNAKFRVQARGGFVTIEGIVGLTDVADAVNDVVGSIEGVTGLANNVTTQLPI